MPKLASQMRVAFSSMVSNTRLQFARRARDDAQHLRGRGLLFQRLAQLLRSFLHVVEQPHVLDGDHRLVGEGLNQFNLFLSKPANYAADQNYHADRASISQERHAQHGPHAREGAPLIVF